MSANEEIVSPDNHAEEAGNTEFDQAWNDVEEVPSGSTGGDESEEKNKPAESGKTDQDDSIKPDDAEKSPGKNDPADSSTKESEDSEKPDYSFLDKIDQENGAPDSSGKTPTEKKEDEQENTETAGKTEEKPKESENPPDSGSFDVDAFIAGLPDDMKEFASDYPEEAKFNIRCMEIMFRKLRGTSGASELENRLAGMEEYLGNVLRFEEQAREQARQIEFQNEVLKVHPDAEEILTKKRDFSEWLKAQPRYLQQAVRRINDPADAIDILNKYKADRGILEKKQNRKNELYRGLSASSERAGKTGNENASFDEAWDEIDDEQVK